MRIIALDINKKVVDTKNVGENYINNPGLQPGEIISELGETGQIMQTDGSFITPEPIPQPIPITLEELQANQLTLMDAMATMYEGLLAKGSI